ncbi:MAG: rhomboid family intramembrane serine protease [Bacteroidota bacterium]|jgi:membrane associated rhomboid family serine protease
MNLLDELKYNYLYTHNAIKRIIAANVAVFLLVALPKVFLFLAGNDGAILQTVLHWFKLPASLSKLATQPWSLISYMFLHDGFFHLLFNMLWLYWIGNILHEYLGNRKVYEVFFMGGLAGALAFIISYSVFPVFYSVRETHFAVGASAGVLSVVIATATLLPDYSIQLLFFGNVRLKYIALIIVLLDIISIPQGNQGGHLAHLGGAVFGYFYIRFIYKYGNLIPDSWLSVFSRKRSIKIYHRAAVTKTETQGSPSQHEIDGILDKISRSGYDSLSKREKEILFKASKD